MNDAASEPAPAPDDSTGPRPRTAWRPADLTLAPSLAEPPAGVVVRIPGEPPPERRPWFLAQLWAEFVLVLRMYVDPRYRISRTAQLLVPGVIGLFVLNYLFFTFWLAVPVFSPIAERLLDVLLGIFLYKLWARELMRYRDVLDYLSRLGERRA